MGTPPIQTDPLSTPAQPPPEHLSPSKGVLLCFGLDAVLNKHIRDCPDAMAEVVCIGAVQVRVESLCLYLQ
jgi:hypothetical protein